ncbi:universal stress protein [Frigidibacter sp. ROC022]|uniref:universal stress protein n=1 Tax=Frigidibacter sp. ROC022 TaxID=2971796 RepID=UPI00215A6F1F|nr:universal stress protein [Frigidibacter sp. ROC022]MCR8724218.1 universal stress protein [Frigidibacter sp. ROC022]
MTWKTLTTFVTDMTLDANALDAAVTLARRFDAHLDVLCLGIDLTQPEVYYTGAQAIALPGAMEEADRHAKTLETAVKQKLDGTDIRWSVSAVATPIVGVSATVSDAARFSDLVIAARPYGEGRGTPQVQIVESALFGADARVLVIPDDAMPEKFDHVALAWNDSPEAMRAMRAALPVMQAASETEIVIVDPPRHGPDRSDPGGRLAQLLARHGVTASIRILARTMPSVSDVLTQHVEDSGTDLLVMGSYGHSRLRESILGGATRNMLEHAKVPVLMVH